MNGNPKDIPSMLRECVDDAMARVPKMNVDVWDETDLVIYAWPQEWPSTSCGFGGVAGQAFTRAQTFVLVCPPGDVLVYHAGRLARHVRKPTKDFWDQFAAGHFPGAADKAWEKFDGNPANKG